MKKFIAIILLFNLQAAICSLHSFAQSIDSVEYFYDVDPGVGNGNVYVVATSDSITDSISFDFPGLTPGFHTLNFRVRDTNGTWSLYENRTFFLNDTIFEIHASFDSSSAEYFFDTDPGVGSGTALKLTPGDSIQDTTIAVAAGLAFGFHNLYVRIKDSNNVWSLYEEAKIYLYDTMTVSVLPLTHPIEAAEYFFDTDPGVGNGTAMNPFAPADSIQLIDSLPSAPLTAGTHRLYVRVRDTMDVWSLQEGKAFVVCNFVPVPDFSSDTVCVNTPTAFTDLSTNVDTNFNYTYAWDFNNDSLTDDTARGNTFHTYNTSGSHMVTLIVNNTNGCTDTITKTIYVDSLPTSTFVLPIDSLCKDDTLALTGGSPAGGVYSGSGVYGGSLYCDSIDAGLHTITYTYYNSDSCSVAISDVVYVSPCTDVHEYDLAGLLVRISPNPFRTRAAVFIQNPLNEFSNLHFVLFDVFGKEIRTLKVESSTLKLDRGNMTAGIYLYKVIGKNGNYVSGKLVVVD
ncbi:MAG: T9SS type A sorting domain-containing protein [Bacteroidetes bacterium]|nr:MAG: T9SS type A sorting domain-containing protein [Bacteroidota bacterium]